MPNELSDNDLRELLELCEKRNCTVCGEERRIVSKVGPIEIKESCGNKCTKGYVRP